MPGRRSALHDCDIVTSSRELLARRCNWSSTRHKRQIHSANDAAKGLIKMAVEAFTRAIGMASQTFMEHPPDHAAYSQPETRERAAIPDIFVMLQRAVAEDNK